MTETRVQPCESCKQPIIPARTNRGREISLERVPVPVAQGGKYAIRDHGGARVLATTPPPHLAFGRLLYIEHEGQRGCSSRAAAARKRGTRRA